MTSNRPRQIFSAAAILGVPLAMALAVAASGCTTAKGAPDDRSAHDRSASERGATAATSAPIAVTAVTAIEQPISRTLRVTGSLTADEQAEVSAETAGRVVRTPVERGSRVKAGDLLIQLSTEQTHAQLQEASANAARIAAGLALTPDAPFDVERVPDVANARAELALAQADYARFKSLLDQRVVSQAEYDQQHTRVEAARQKYEAERNAAHQEYQSLEAARARVVLARKSLADTTVRAPFAGEVVERRVSVGDYVSMGTPVATVVRSHPLRVLLSVSEQSVGLVKTGQPVTLRVDAYPDRTFTGTVRFVSPSLRAEQRALMVEALVPNESGELKPGFFATAFIEQPAKTPAVLIDRRAIRDVAATKRVFVIAGEKVEERILTVGQIVDGSIEVVSGLKAGERVALPGPAPSGATLTDGATVRVSSTSPGPPPAGSTTR